MKKCDDCKSEIEGKDFHFISKSESEIGIVCNNCYDHLDYHRNE